MPVLEFVGQSVRDAGNVTANPGRLINCYREPVGEGGKTRMSLQPVPGMEAFAMLSGVFMRATEVIDGTLFAVCGDTLFSVASSGFPTAIGTVAVGDDVTISGHDGAVTITSGGVYYVWDGTTLSAPTGGAFSAVGSVDAVSSYSIMTEAGGKRFQWSALGDAKTLNGLNFASADERDDNLLRVVAINGLVWLFGEGSIEIWYETSAGGPDAFAQLAGGVHDIGLKSFGLIAEFDGGAFFVADDDLVRVTNGTGFQVVSTPAVIAAIKDGQPRTCIHYEDRGHKFCAIVFDDRPAWVFDLATQEWHERMEGTEYGPWDVSTAVRFRNEWIAGRDDGRLVYLRGLEDLGAALVREFTSRTLTNDGQRFRVAELELTTIVGVHAGSIMFWLSQDGGLTWGKERTLSLGETGDYGRRLIKRGLGQFRQATLRARITDAVPVPLYADGRVVLA